MDDLISRQAAIRAIEDRYYKYGRFAKIEELVWSIERLPSVQPKIIRCKDCKNWDTAWENDLAKNYYYCPFQKRNTHGDWYCADAERKTNE